MHIQDNFNIIFEMNDKKEIISIRILVINVLLVIALAFLGCVVDGNSPNTKPNGNIGTPSADGSDTRWSQYHGDLSNRGFQLKPTRDAITPVWSTIVGQATVSSPVLGRDNANRETLYIGTIDGKLVAFQFDTQIVETSGLY
jgi:hypothetical protein